MNGVLRVLVLVILSVASTAAAQERSDQIGPSALISGNACHPTDRSTCGADMVAVQRALASPAALWEFLTSPTAGYFERRVAASRAGRLVPVEWIDKINAVGVELGAEGRLHHFGIQQHPYDARGRWGEKSPRDLVGGQVNRFILGHMFVVPDAWIDFPMTDDELRQSPWPRQVGDALAELWWAIVRDGDPSAVDSYALGLPCADAAGAAVLVQLTRDVVIWQRFASPSVFGVWLNVIRNPDMQSSVETITIILDHLSDIDYAMAETLGLEALKNGDAVPIRATRFFSRPPYALIVAASRAVLDLNAPRGANWTLQDRANAANVLRYAAFPDPNAPSPVQLSADEDASRLVLASFAEWFRVQEPPLLRNAAIEQPLIDRAYQQMSGATSCRAGK